MPGIPQLRAGDTLTWKEFERRWDADPKLKRAELIGGKVYMPSPLYARHSELAADVIGFVGYYSAKTRGTHCYSQPTLRILDDAPQPDTLLCTYDGNCRVKGLYLHDAPEMVAETCASSAAYDLNEKKDLYEEARIDEYIAVLLHEHEVRWHRLERGKYKLLSCGRDGIYHSIVFPGLWLNSSALLKGNLTAVIATLDAGLSSPEHAKFMKTLKARAE